MDLVFESELDWDRLLCQIEGDLEAGFTYRSVASDVETYWLLPAIKEKKLSTEQAYNMSGLTY